MATVEEVRQALSKVMDPELKRSLVDLGMVRDVRTGDNRVTFTLALTTLACPLKERIVAEAKAAVLALDGVEEVDVEVTEMSAEEKRRIMSAWEQPGRAEHLNDIKRVIAIMSGKGGVGKSLVAALLAVALRREGHEVGILDADITGPSIPKMFFPTPQRPHNSPMGLLPARSRLGIKIMSINLLLPHEDDAVIWRGPLIGGAIKQFWGDVFWGHLDYMIVDLPPGTSDASLTVMQSLPLSGVVLVSSPQDLAGMVVRKAAQMASHLGVPILGLVENMSYFICPDTGKRYDIFGPSHAEEMAQQMGIPFLGRLPIQTRIAELCDSGAIEEVQAQEFAPIAQRLAEMAPEARQPLFPI
ncbi:MAG TPA: iron-sulfur cluster carrier protein ApbC [Anaerolineae bacterium]|nr:iron-sulfur cluster carrier protein ApbC [Anaerolineae bacterium]